jgi:hypothetical protein
MKKILILLLLSLIIACTPRHRNNNNNNNSITKIKPMVYETGVDSNYPEDSYITGIGEGNSREIAIYNSKKEISEKILSSLKSSFTHSKKAYMKNSKLVYNKQRINSTLKMTTEFKHANFIKNVNVFYDNKNKIYYAFSALSRYEYSKILEPELADLKKQFANKYNLALDYLNRLNFDKFRKAYTNINSNEFNLKLMQYSVVINDLDYYKNENLLKNLTKINNIYEGVTNTTWIVNAVRKNLPNLPKNKKWQWDSDDEKVVVKDENLTKILYNSLKDKKINVNEVDLPSYQLKLNNSMINQITKTQKGRIVLWADLQLRCSASKKGLMYYCRSKVNIIGKLLGSGEDIISFSYGSLNRFSRNEVKENNIKLESFKGAGISFKKAYRNSIERLKSSLIKKIKDNL